MTIYPTKDVKTDSVLSTASLICDSMGFTVTQVERASDCYVPEECPSKYCHRDPHWGGSSMSQT